MAYIIENANVLKESELKKISLLIKDERIHSLNSSFKRFSYMRVDADSFVMTPSHIIFSPNIPCNTSFQQMKLFFTETFINRGSTMFLTYTSIEKEYLLKKSLQEMKKNLLNSPIDFTIGIRIPLNLLTPNLIRMCKKEKVPVIFVEVDVNSSFEHVPWGWVREAMFPYNSPLVPIFTTEKPKQRRSAQAQWTSILSSEKIPFIENELRENEPISAMNLSKIGIYPKKMGIHQGGEVSYNFYAKEDGMMGLGEKELFQKFPHKLMVTVHKGTVIRADTEVFFRPGYGEHVIIQTPSFFSIDS